MAWGAWMRDPTAKGPILAEWLILASPHASDPNTRLSYTLRRKWSLPQPQYNFPKLNSKYENNQ